MSTEPGERITDLSVTRPATAWTDADATIHSPISVRPPGGWRLVDYLVGDIRGRALQTSCADSWPVGIPLEASGTYAVSLAMAGHHDQDVLDVRLSGEEHWQTLRAGHGPVQEVPWRFAHLDQDTQLEVRYPRDIKRLPGRLRGQALSARLFWVRLQPLAEHHAAQLQDDEQRPLVYLNDGHSLFWWDSEVGDHDIVQGSLGRFADSEWQTCCFCNGGADLVNYPSQLGTPFGEGGWDDPLPRNLKTARIIAELNVQGIDVLAEAINCAHRQDQDFWFHVRPQAWVGEPPFDHAFRSAFFSNHPEYRCRNAAGQALGKLSYAYPQVRTQVNGIFDEALARGADALGMALVRAMPLVRYEQPVIDRAKEKYGLDARELEEDDERLLAVWGEFTHTWLSELRQLLDSAGPDRHGQRRQLFLICGPSPDWHRQYGMDIAALAADGLVDTVMPYPFDAEDLDITAWREHLADAGQVKLLPGLGNFLDHGLGVAALQRRALTYYEAGADGLNRWDTPAWLIGLNLHRPQWLRLWQEHYLGEQEMPLREYAGLWLEESEPLDAF